MDLDNDKALLDYTYALSQHYGQAIGALSCQMYEATAAAQGVIYPYGRSSTPSGIRGSGESGNAAHMKQSPDECTSERSARLVKQVGADTTLEKCGA